jgi:hypothetical protein
LKEEIDSANDLRSLKNNLIIVKILAAVKKSAQTIGKVFLK